MKNRNILYWVVGLVIIIFVVIYLNKTIETNQPDKNITEITNNSESFKTISNPEDVGNKTTSSTDSNLFIKQQACSQLLNDFIIRTKKDYSDEADKYSSKWVQNFNNFVVGYSSSLNSCIGGYEFISSINNCTAYGLKIDPCEKYNGQYVITNLSTNQFIAPVFSWDPSFTYEDKQEVAYQKYKAKLSKLTDGQIK